MDVGFSCCDYFLALVGLVVVVACFVAASNVTRCFCKHAVEQYKYVNRSYGIRAMETPHSSQRLAVPREADILSTHDT